jgi:signal transduction histidine kinase
MAAGRFGRGETVPPLAEQGTLDVQETIRAFNHMRDCFERFVQDRTRKLAAISHDLRTPITVLRVRLEASRSRETGDVGLGIASRARLCVGTAVLSC